MGLAHDIVSFPEMQSLARNASGVASSSLMYGSAVGAVRDKMVAYFHPRRCIERYAISSIPNNIHGTLMDNTIAWARENAKASIVSLGGVKIFLSLLSKLCGDRECSSTTEHLVAILVCFFFRHLLNR